MWERLRFLKKNQNYVCHSIFKQTCQGKIKTHGIIEKIILTKTMRIFFYYLFFVNNCQELRMLTWLQAFSSFVINSAPFEKAYLKRGWQCGSAACSISVAITRTIWLRPELAITSRFEARLSGAGEKRDPDYQDARRRRPWNRVKIRIKCKFEQSRTQKEKDGI